jgi:hypothetical protein
MIFNVIQTVSARIRWVAVVLLLSTFTLSIAGCSMFSAMERATKQISRGIGASDGDLKKMVGLALFENKTLLVDQGLGGRFVADLVETIQASCSNIILVKPSDPDYPDYLTDIPKMGSGLIDNFDLAKAGRQLGLNAIVVGAIKDISKIEKEHGMLWFKGTHDVVQVQIGVEVYDTETGAKIFDEDFMDEIEVEGFDLNSIRSMNELNMSVINDAFEHLAADMGEKVCDTIVSEPWKGYITSIAGDKILLSSGKRAGLVPGDEFDVYESGGVFQGAGGHRFFIPGPKASEIKIMAVFANTAEAVRISGPDIREGSSIRPKN